MSLRPGVLFQTAPTLSTHQFHIWVHAGAGIERMALWQAIKKSKDTSVLVRSCKYRSNNVQLPKWYDGALGAAVYHTKPSGSLVTCVTGWSRGDRVKLGAVWHIPKLLCVRFYTALFFLCAAFKATWCVTANGGTLASCIPPVPANRYVQFLYFFLNYACPTTCFAVRDSLGATTDA